MDYLDYSRSNNYVNDYYDGKEVFLDLAAEKTITPSPILESAEA